MQPSSRRFSPTRLATTLTSSSPPLPTSTGTSSGPKEGFIVLETNYRIYAYTGKHLLALLPTFPYFPSDNPLQTAVLNLFVSLKYRFPNLVVGSITRDSVKKALSNGISADQVANLHFCPTVVMSQLGPFQIISYLISHAHPQMRKNVRLLSGASPFGSQMKSLRTLFSPLRFKIRLDCGSWKKIASNPEKVHIHFIILIINNDSFRRISIYRFRL